MTPEEIRALALPPSAPLGSPGYSRSEGHIVFAEKVLVEIAAQLAEFNQSFKFFARDTEDIANLISHSVFCPCCNCHEEEEEPSGSTN